MGEKINRGKFLQIAGLGATASLAMPHRLFGSETEVKRPNIIFIFTDDHASHAISAYGSKINKTPNIDRLAKEGMIFQNCFCTNSICAPSRAVILTGKHSHLNGVPTNRETFDGSQQTFPKLLQRSGYQTAMIGKWHLKSEPTGFDFWKVLIGQGPYYNPVLRTAQGNEKFTGYTTDILTDVALDWLKNERDSSKPFMLMYQHKAPHRNWQPGPDHLRTYEGETIPEPETLFDNYDNRATPAKLQEMSIERELSNNDLKLTTPRNFTDEQLEEWNEVYVPKNEEFREADLKGKELVRWKYQRYIKDYLRCIASVDDNIGRVLDYLDESGLAENTVVIYSSDQGFYLGDHGWFDKRWMYEESLRMPFIVRWPKAIQPGSENRDLVQNLDFAETFLDLAEAEIPDDMQGQSLVPLFKNKTAKDWRQSIYYQYYEFPGYHSVRRHYGVRTDRYKLIYYYNFNEWELFDLNNDPDELKSVYNDPKYSDIVKELKTELERLRKHYKADQYDEPPAPPAPGKVKPKLVLHYDFAKANEKRITDASGFDHHGFMGKSRMVEGRKGKALALSNGGSVIMKSIPQSLNPAFKPFVVGAWCKSESNDGVLFTLGERNFGLGLYLENGRPHFVLRSDAVLYVAAGSENIKPGNWFHIAGKVDKQGFVHLLVNGKPVGQAEERHFIQPRSMNMPGNMTLGLDPNGITPIEQKSFKGFIEDLRLYWGEPDQSKVDRWMK